MTRKTKTILKNFRMTVPQAQRLTLESERTGRSQRFIVRHGLFKSYKWREFAK